MSEISERVAEVERKLAQLEPPEGFTVAEWHIGQTLAMGLMPFDSEISDETIIAFRDAMKARFPEQCEKFADYMGWKRRPNP
jgi:hypothetical protein